MTKLVSLTEALALIGQRYPELDAKDALKRGLRAVRWGDAGTGIIYELELLSPPRPTWLPPGVLPPPDGPPNMVVRDSDIDRLWPAPPVLDRSAAIRAALARGDKPGQNVPWKTFIASLEAACGAPKGARGFDIKTIRRLVAKQK